MLKKLANKLKKKPPGKKGEDQELVRPVWDEVNAKYLTVDPVPPAPRPFDDHRNRAGKTGQSDRQDDDVGTFSGFGDWMATFKPDPVARNVVEADAEAVRPYVDELLTMPGNFREDLLMSLVLSGARKPSNSASFTVEIRGPWFMTLRGVNGLLAEHGYEKMVSARRAQGAASNWSGDDAAPTEFEIPVIDGTSLIDLDGPEPLLLIGRDEQIGAFCDKVRRLRVRCKDGKVTATSFPAQLEITFNRTLRLPEDGKIHNQPMRLDRIGVNNIASIAKKLEASQNGSLMDIARKGGVFFPLCQREAMFLSFKARHDAFAVRVFTGGVNAVSGLAWTVDMPRQMRTNAQDYLAVPPQRFLDGVCVAKDVVRQFIAMPLGSGYSIEKQVTGKEDVGGMQIQIAPANGWMLKIPGQDFFISEGRLTPRLLAVELLSLHKVRGWANTQDEMEDKKRFFDETMPVYIRHLYQSQVVRPPGTYGDASHLTAFYAGLTVSMVAMYMLNITLSYRDKGTQRMTTVEWAPWWTLDRCFAERRSAGFQVDGNFIEGMELYDQGRPLRRGGETLQQQGMLDQAVVIVQPREVGYPHPNYQYVSESGSGQQSAMAPGLDVQQQQTSGYGHHGYPAASVPHQQGYSYQFQYRPPQELQSYQAPGPQSAPGSTQPQSQQTPQTPSYYAPSSPSWGSPPPSMVSPQQSFGSSDMYTPPRPPKISSSAPPPSASPSYGSPPPMPFQPPPQPQSPSFPTAAPPSYGSPPPMPFQQPPPQTQAWASPPPPSSPSPATTTAAASPVVSEQGYYYSSPSTASPSVPASMVSSMPSMTSGMPASTGPSSSSYGSPPPRQSYPGQTSAAVPPAQQPKPQDQTGWAMGLAAGSRLRQAILRDPFGPAAWSKDRATLLSVQILNSVAFEALTGMLAPASTVTPQTYLEQGLPFFASYAEGVVTDGGANLAGVRSVGEIDALDGSLRLGVDASGGKVGCTVCEGMLCNSILRPCNHAFCSPCISKYMTFGGQAVVCRLCNTKASRLVGFSAPMALPGEDRVDLDKAEIITLDPPEGSVEFHSVELDAEAKGGGYAPPVFELAG